MELMRRYAFARGVSHEEKTAPMAPQSCSSGSSGKSLPVSARYLLAPYATFEGPAVIEERESTLIVGRGATVSVDALLDVVIEIERENGEAAGAGE